MFSFWGKRKQRDDWHSRWGRDWRSSDAFIISTLSLALFTDELLFAFMIPLLPTVLEDRIGIDPSNTQWYISVFLIEGAFVSVASSPMIGSIADAVSSKQMLLLSLLGIALVSVVCLSLTTTLAWLFVGRFFQCIASNALWIVGMATMAENIGTENMGKIAGFSSMLTSAGTTAGPVLAGLLFATGGYWAAWAGAAAFLVIDIVMRLLMVEKPPQDRKTVHEQDPLLNGRPTTESTELVQGWRFYACLFRQPRFSAGIFCYFVFAFVISCFETTLSVHVRDAFGWGVLPVGLLLAAIQGPGTLLAPPVGWLKDRVGSRTPTVIGFFGLVPFVVTMGFPGDERFPWLEGDRGKIIYAICMVLSGCFMCLMNGVGSMEAAETIDILEKENQGIFGPNGGYCRAMALTSMTWMAGLMCGPLLGGLIVQQAGYFELQCFVGGAALIAGCIAFSFLHSHSDTAEE